MRIVIDTTPVFCPQVYSTIPHICISVPPHVYLLTYCPSCHRQLGQPPYM